MMERMQWLLYLLMFVRYGDASVLFDGVGFHCIGQHCLLSSSTNLSTKDFRSPASERVRLTDYRLHQAKVEISNDAITRNLVSSDASYVSLQPAAISRSLGSALAAAHSSTATTAPELQQAAAIDGFSISADDINKFQFGAIFRQCAPYIAMHRGSTMVIHLGGKSLINREEFEAVIDDISILHLLGIQLVLVAGVRRQLDEKIQAGGRQPLYHDGMRVTDDDTMRHLKEASGLARFEIESSLARGFRGRPGQSGINVVSGNFFYSAKPLGVRGGVDYKLTGEVRRVEVDNMKKRLESGDVVLLTSLGYSPSGEVFNVPSESLAAECAAKLKAAKVIYLTEGEALIDTRTGKNIQSLRLAQAISLLAKCGVKEYIQGESDATEANTAEFLSSFTKSEQAQSLQPPEQEVRSMEATGALADGEAWGITTPSAGGGSGQPPVDDLVPLGMGVDLSRTTPAVAGFVRLLARCVYALSGGVRRAHLLSPGKGAILKELYTRDGAGILVSRDVYDGILQAQASDVRTVEEIIRPLEEQGILVPRTREQLEKDMQDCFLMTRDGSTIACGMLKRYSDTHAEVCCLAVHPSYRREGRGETLLAYLERRALLMGITELFVLSTRTMQWFEERGFVSSDPSLLPPTRQYNKARGSKVYIKVLGSQRDIDVEELMWNI